VGAIARMLVVWCPDWPVTAAGAPSTKPVAVLHSGRVVACSAAAQVEGVRRGQRRREAQAYCPELELIPHDPGRDARAFEPVLAAVESLTPKVEVLDPGECAFRAQGAARYYGGEPALATAVANAVDRVLGALGRCRTGIADGRFAAGLAARRSLVARHGLAVPHGPHGPPDPPGPGAQHGLGDARQPGPGAGHHVIVPPNEAADFLAPFPVGVLERPELTDTFVRLGLTTLGQLAALPRAALAARFGAEGVRAHRLASGMDEYPRASRRSPPDLGVAVELDPPAGRVDVAAFAAKTLADELVERLERLGLTCTRLRIEVETEHGETLARVWRHELSARPPSRRGAASTDPCALQAAAMAERVRWQLDGWLSGAAAARPTGAITRLALAPDEVVPARGRQLGFWGEEAEASRRAARTLARVQGLLGPEAVRKVSLQGGRGPADQVVSVAEGELPVSTGEPPATPMAPDPHLVRGAGPGPGPGSGPVPGVRPPVRGVPAAGGAPGTPEARPQTAPWPGRIPEPSPAVVHPDPPPAEVQDDQGEQVAVNGRGLLSASPSRLRVSGGPWASIVAWAGPWPVDERWWDQKAQRRLARLQVTTGGGTAYLLKLTGGRWWVEATYD
jgi:protein ImuB